jgi:rhamnose utilization protein RhaD (predicted bifunctional aldolase and dehydrogenase)
MKSLWNDADADAAVARYAEAGVGEDLALRTYSARLLGGDPRLVLHGGGNTSVKTTAHDLFGEPLDVLCVKGSGWDLATIEPPGHPAVRLAPLLRLRSLVALSDEAMVNAQRQNLLDANAPTPSVETLLHAFMPERFIDHTHAVAVLAIADQPNAQVLVERLYGEDVACVPYVPPGFDLARLAADAYDARPGLKGMILLNHGVFSFGDTARASYERMIELVSIAEGHIAGHAGPPAPRASAPSAHDIARRLAVLRGLLAAGAPGAPSHWALDLRRGEDALGVCAAPNLPELAERGVATPDHVIRTKRAPLVLPDIAQPMEAWGAAAAERMSDFVQAYQAYFARNAPRVGGRRALDPLPRLVAAPGLGLVGIGRNAREAGIAADIGEAWAATALAAEAIGRFTPIGEADTFDMEYWSLEQAKLGKTAFRRLEGHIVAITGGAGAIGAAAGRAFAREGAQVALIDIDEAGVRAAARAIGRDVLGVSCDLTRPQAAEAALDQVCRRFGGLDIVVSNAGMALPGAMESLPDETRPWLRRRCG